MNIDTERIRREAAEARRRLGFTLMVPIDVWAVLRTEGVSVVKRPFRSDVSGVFMRRGPTVLVLINSARTLGHQNFTAAHEYFHFRYDEELLMNVCKADEFDPRNVREREADVFAAHFLAPDEAVEMQVLQRLRGRRRELNLADIIALEQLFGLSHEAMLRRLVETGHLADDARQLFSKGVIQAARLYGYDTKLYQPTNDHVILSDYLEKAKQALDLGLISQGRYEEMLLEAGYADLVFGYGEGDEA